MTAPADRPFAPRAHRDVRLDFAPLEPYNGPRTKDAADPLAQDIVTEHVGEHDRKAFVRGTRGGRHEQLAAHRARTCCRRRAGGGALQASTRMRRASGPCASPGSPRGRCRAAPHASRFNDFPRRPSSIRHAEARGLAVPPSVRSAPQPSQALRCKAAIPHGVAGWAPRYPSAAAAWRDVLEWMAHARAA